MTELQKAQLKASENRSELSKLLATPEGDRPDDYGDKVEELSKRAAVLEIEIRGHMTVESAEGVGRIDRHQRRS